MTDNKRRLLHRIKETQAGGKKALVVRMIYKQLSWCPDGSASYSLSQLNVKVRGKRHSPHRHFSHVSCAALWTPLSARRSVHHLGPDWFLNTSGMNGLSADIHSRLRINCRSFSSPSVSVWFKALPCSCSCFPWTWATKMRNIIKNRNIWNNFGCFLLRNAIKIVPIVLLNIKKRNLIQNVRPIACEQ